MVLGVNPDSLESHRKFKKKLRLPYRLLSDDGHRLADAFGIWKEKSMYGRKYMGVERTTIVIDPAMAFGTGEHATTRGVVRLMQRVITSESTVADLGAGSAVLSIAAAKLGAARAIAIELDHDAAGNASENIRVNGVSGRVHFVEGDAFTILPLVAPVSVVFANILSSVLVELLPVIHDSLAPAGHAILSGILFEEREMMLDQIGRGDWRVDAEDSEEEWWSVLISRS